MSDILYLYEVCGVISLCLYLKHILILYMTYMMRNYETWQSPGRSVKLRKFWNSSHINTTGSAPLSDVLKDYHG